MQSILTDEWVRNFSHKRFWLKNKFVCSHPPIFLDLKIRIKFEIFRKVTQTDNYIKQKGFNPISHKHAIFYSLTYRLTNVPFNTLTTTAIFRNLFMEANYELIRNQTRIL